jgi:hypothetical protein
MLEPSATFLRACKGWSHAGAEAYPATVPIALTDDGTLHLVTTQEREHARMTADKPRLRVLVDDATGHPNTVKDLQPHLETTPILLIAATVTQLVEVVRDLVAARA